MPLSWRNVLLLLPSALRSKSSLISTQRYRFYSLLQSAGTSVCNYRPPRLSLFCCNIHLCVINLYSLGLGRIWLSPFICEYSYACKLKENTGGAQLTHQESWFPNGIVVLQGKGKQPLKFPIDLRQFMLSSTVAFLDYLSNMT